MEMSLLQKLVNVCLIQPRIRKLKKLLPDCVVLPAGSKWVCDPPPLLNSDIDIQVYSRDGGSTHDRLVEASYKLSVRDTQYFANAEGRINCYRSWSGLTNVIVSLTEHEYVSFSTATFICKKYNLLTKNDRITVHSILRGEENWEADNLMSDTYKANPELVQLLKQLGGRHRETLLKAYRIKHGLEVHE